jgi:membrane protein DedA with SNARE-associated domain
MSSLVDFILHADSHLTDFVAAYGIWIYALLFLIVFAETGFVVTPFLPGDSLLFAAGALCARGSMSASVCFVLLATAAFTGNAVNYGVGRFVGPRIFTATDHQGFWHNLLNSSSTEAKRSFSVASCRSCGPSSPSLPAPPK